MALNKPLAEAPTEWQTSLLGCLDQGDCGSCMFSWCCPCFAEGSNAAFAGRSYVIACLGTFLCPCICMTITRGRLRETLGISDGGCFSDCMVSCCCPCCSIIQSTTERLSRTEHETTDYGIQEGKPYDRAVIIAKVAAANANGGSQPAQQVMVPQPAYGMQQG